MITPVVDYFHVLPYYEIVSEWISREAFSNGLHDSRVTEKNIMVNSPEVTESHVNKDMSTGPDSKPSSDNFESPKQKGNNGSCTIRLSDSFKWPCEMDVNESSIPPSQNKRKRQDIDNTIQVGKDKEKNNPSMQYSSNGSASDVKHFCTSLALLAKDACDGQSEAPRCGQPPSARPLSTNIHQAVNVDSTRMLITEGGTNNLASCNKICGNRPNTSTGKDTADDRTLIANNSKSDLEKLQILLDSKKILSQTALTALMRKRNELALRQREIEDEIAICDEKIRRMLVDGEDDYELKIESIIEGCNDIWLRNQERTCGQQSVPFKRKKLSEAVFILQNPCQELDGVCHENNWVLPTYHLSHSDGGFQANVSVKGVEFECSCGGKVCSNPREARESAAAQMLTNLISMPKSAQ